MYMLKLDLLHETSVIFIWFSGLCLLIIGTNPDDNTLYKYKT